MKKRLYKEAWYKNGITLVGDLISNNTGKVMSMIEIENMYNFKIKNFLDYFEVRDTVKKIIGELDHESKRLERPCIPNHLSFIVKEKKGCKNIYNIINNGNCENNYRSQWNQDLSIIIDNATWRRIFYLCFNTILDNRLIWFQYKLLYRILGTNKLLHQIGRSKKMPVGYVTQILKL